jgi:hypothetical protein
MTILRASLLAFSLASSIISCCRVRAWVWASCFQAFYQLRFGFFSAQAGNFFKAADMLFLVFLQFGAFLVNHFYLAVQVFFDQPRFPLSACRGLPSFWLMAISFCLARFSRFAHFTVTLVHDRARIQISAVQSALWPRAAFLF